MDIADFEFRTPADFIFLRDRLQSRGLEAGGVRDKVLPILEDVRTHGDQALVKYTRRFDCPDFSASDLELGPRDMEEAMHRVDTEQLRNIQEAVERIRSYHLRQRENSWFDPGADGAMVGQMNLPVQSAGLYVPGGQGGKTPLVSSLIMTAVPALVAGVENICPVSPPGKNGSLNDYILATAGVLGLNRIFCCGSAWAIAALAWGTETIPRVDVIAGPGNIFVSSAKEMVSGIVGIDMIAGPSEIAILADDSAHPEWLAADMLSQAEHDPLAASILVSPEQRVLDSCRQQLQAQADTLPRRDIALESLNNCGALIRVPDLETGLELINMLAPEHFELCVRDPWEMLGRVKNAGAVFLGHFSPEAAGDYFAGPNHVLPTLFSARYSSALSVDFFTKKTSIVAASREYMREHGDKIAALARLEGLEAHARSAEMRTGKFRES